MVFLWMPVSSVVSWSCQSIRGELGYPGIDSCDVMSTNKTFSDVRKTFECCKFIIPCKLHLQMYIRLIQRSTQI